MTDQLISFETAKLANKKGLYIPESDYAYFNGHLQRCGGQVYNPKERCEAPTQSLLQKWLREIHNIHFRLYEPNTENEYKWICFTSGNLGSQRKTIGDTYEEALEIGLQEALKLINL